MLWIALEKAPQDSVGLAGRRSWDSSEDADGIAPTPATESRADRQADNAMSVRECAAALQQVEARLRDVEAFITSRRFRLHCEIKRI